LIEEEIFAVPESNTAETMVTAVTVIAECRIAGCFALAAENRVVTVKAIHALVAVLAF
jgi:hypothetical protein